MKTTIAILISSILLGACAGGDGMMRLGGCPPVKGGETPSGCQVPGHGNYYMRPGSTEVVQVANPKSIRNILRTNREPVDSPK